MSGEDELMTDAVRLGRTLVPYPGDHLFVKVPWAVEHRGKAPKFVVHALSQVLLSNPLPQNPPLSTHVPLSHLGFRVSHRFLRIYRAPTAYLESGTANVMPEYDEQLVLGVSERSTPCTKTCRQVPVTTRAGGVSEHLARVLCP